MKKLLSTLYGKISLIFLVLLFILGSVQLIIFVQSSLNFVCETDQTLNRNLAKNLADKFKQFLTDSLDYAGIEHTFHEMMIMNPRVEIYLLDTDGNLMAYFAPPEKIKRMRVNLTPIKKFLSNESQPLPIMADDPRTTDKEKIFSAAEVSIGPNRKGYLYVILGGELYDSAFNGVGESYILRTTVMTLVMIILFAAVLGSLLFFNLTKRLRAMTQAVREFEHGNLQKRIPVKSNDEVGQLTHAFNNMADSLEANVEELKKNDSLRRELIANVSHDLRSPLASIQGYLETILMKEDEMNAIQRKNFLETILSSVTNLSHLVHELFELSKLDAMQTTPNPEPFSIAELVQDVVLKFQPQAATRGINLITKIPRDLPFVVGDIGMIDRVLSNLIDNAIRYTSKNGKIMITLDDDIDEVNINVSDTGEGIPREDIPHIFDRFYRVEKSRSRNSGGSGLGLAIVKKIVEAHKSNIYVESKMNAGTTFAFGLKKYNPALEAVRI